MRTLPVLLAAGASSRFRGSSHKLLAELSGRPLWRHAVDHLLGAGFEEAVIITGAAAIPAAEVGDTVLEVVPNPQWVSGQASSLRLGMGIAEQRGFDAILVGLADQPFVSASAWRAVADAPPTCELVVATYDGRPGPHPVRIAAALWPQLAASGDEGARALLGRLGERVCSVPCLGSGADIDTLEDLARWTSC